MNCPNSLSALKYSFTDLYKVLKSFFVFADTLPSVRTPPIMLMFQIMLFFREAFDFDGVLLHGLTA